MYKGHPGASSLELDDTEALRPEAPDRGLLRDAGLIVAPIVLAVVNLSLGRSEFGGYDLSALIDAGWRVMNGQVPTASFICTLPPSFYLLATGAFRLFGVTWASLLYSESLLYLLLCFLGLRLCQLLRAAPDADRDRWLPVVYIAAQSLSLLAANHLWHSTTASGVAAYAILATYTLIRLGGGRGAAEATAHIAFGFAFLLLSKPNTAWSAVLLCGLCLAVDRRLRRAALLAIAAAVAADFILLAALGISPYNAFYSYPELGNRAIPKLFFVAIDPELSLRDLLLNPPVYVFLLWPAWCLVRIAWTERWRLFASPAGLTGVSAVAVSLIGFGTNSDLKIVDVAPFLVGAAVLTATSWAGASERRRKSLTRALLWSAGFIFVLAASLGIQRTRMIAVGNWAGPVYGAKIRIHDRFFGDFTTRRYFAELLAEVDFVTAHTAGRKTFFGPRLEFLYARDGLPSPAHLPVWWHSGTSYPVAMEPSAVEAWKDDQFDVLVFQRNDRTRFPPELLWYIDARYTWSADFPTLDVYYRK